MLSEFNFGVLKMWLSISSWLEQTCKNYCSQSVYNTLYHYFGWNQFQSLPSRCLQELGQYFSKSTSGNFPALYIGTGLVLMSAVTLFFTRNHTPKDSINGIKIKMEYTRGIHDSRMDFPLKASPKYDVTSSSAIVLDFGHKIFILPRMFMH